MISVFAEVYNHENCLERIAARSVLSAKAVGLFVRDKIRSWCPPCRLVGIELNPGPNNNNNKNKNNKKSKKVRSTYKDVAPNQMVRLNVSGGILFPPRLRFSGRVALNVSNVFTAAANIYNYLDINNPIAVSASQNMSGLAWLLSGAQNNGTSYAPYNLGIVRTALIEVYAKTAASPNSNTGALITMYPLPLAVSASSLSLTQAEEQFGRSNIIECPLGLNTVSRSRPMISKSYKIWELIGVSEEVYMSDFQAYSFGYAGLLTGASAQDVCVQTGTESASTDTTLSIRLNIIVTLEIELFSRNNLITSAPHA